MKITFLCPHLRIAGGVRAILIHADRLAGRGHDVTLLVPARRALAAWWRNRVHRPPEWMPGLRVRVRWVPEWSAAGMPKGDVVVATSWQSVEAVAGAGPGPRDGFHRLPRGGDHYVALRHARRAPLRHPAHPHPEPRHPLGGAMHTVAPPRGEGTPGRHEQGHVVAAPGQTVGVDEDGAHPARDAQMRAEEGDLHPIWPPSYRHRHLAGAA